LVERPWRRDAFDSLPAVVEASAASCDSPAAGIFRR
jgi:hypothetical protein